LVGVVLCLGWSIALANAQSAPTGPVLIVETSRGTFSIQTYPREAPATVAHVADLARRGFYDGQRVHRAIPGFVVQFGDPQTRDLSSRELWGRGDAAASGKPVGTAEFHKNRRHRKGAVALAHMGDPAKGDSQMFVALADREDLDGRYVVFGQVVSGLEVPAQLAVGDDILRILVRE
jgi:cyclophilin family peptidyl-prolyl cis-trans isomerase